MFLANARRDDGSAMIITILVGMIGFVFLVSIFTRNSADFNRVSDDRRREQAIHDADGGLEHALYRIDQNPAWSTPIAGTYPGTFATKQQERQWAIDQVVSASLDTVKAPDGDWAVVKPPGIDVIYGVGYLPSRADARNIRVVRADYDFAPFEPEHALLTDGDMYLSGNPVIGGDAHANGDVTKVGGTISGAITSSGTCPSQCTDPTFVAEWEESGGGRPLEVVPLVNPRENYEMSQFDLCPGGAKGVVKAGPSHPTDGDPLQEVPCAGTTLFDGESGLTGWSGKGLDPSSSQAGYIWEVNNNPDDGVFYIYQGSVKITGNPGNPTPWRATIFAEATVPSGSPEKDHCPHVGGDIETGGTTQMVSHDTGYPLLLIAGRDLAVQGNPTSAVPNYGGVLAAHEQIQFGGNPKIVGVAFSNDFCNTEHSAATQRGIDVNGNPTIEYEGLSIPFGRTIRLARWLEL